MTNDKINNCPYAKNAKVADIKAGKEPLVGYLIIDNPANPNTHLMTLEDVAEYVKKNGTKKAKIMKFVHTESYTLATRTVEQVGMIKTSLF